MTKTIHLGPHDPVPAGPGRQVVVLRRFEEDSPDKASIQIILTGGPDQVTHPHRPDGTPMHLDEVIQAAGRVAEEEGLESVFVLDRLQGGREQDILRHDGDHTIHMERLADSDEVDGERGVDMRDIAHPERST